MTGDEALDHIAAGYRASPDEATAESPLHSALAAAVAEDREVLRFLAGLPSGRRQPTLLLAGDLVDRLPDARAPVPDGTTPVVLHTAVLPYLAAAHRTTFVDLVRSLPVRWIAQEGAGLVPGTESAHPGEWGPYLVLSLDGRPLARTAPHGGRVDRLPAD